MEWLNRLDDVLDSALRPRKRTRPPENSASAPSSTSREGSAEKEEKYSHHEPIATTGRGPRIRPSPPAPTFLSSPPRTPMPTPGRLKAVRRLNSAPNSSPPSSVSSFFQEEENTIDAVGHVETVPPDEPPDEAGDASTGGEKTQDTSTVETPGRDNMPEPLTEVAKTLFRGKEESEPLPTQDPESDLPSIPQTVTEAVITQKGDARYLSTIGDMDVKDLAFESYSESPLVDTEPHDSMQEESKQRACQEDISSEQSLQSISLQNSRQSPVEEDSPSLPVISSNGLSSEVETMKGEDHQADTREMDSPSPKITKSDPVEPEDPSMTTKEENAEHPPDVAPKTPDAWRQSDEESEKVSSARRSMSPVQEGSQEETDNPLWVKNGHQSKESSRSLETSRPSQRVKSRQQHSVCDVEEISLLSDLREFPRQIVFKSEFEVNHAPESWNATGEDGPPFDSSMNCFGVVHVRILRAQRLPCPVGSSVQAIVSLPPWKGRIRTQKTTAFAGSRRSGVCADWSDDENTISMVNAYSSEESPVPSIKVRIVFGTLGMFEFGMGSLEVSCNPLLRQPMTPLMQWFRTTPEGKERLENIPLVQIEAMFEPEEKSRPSAPAASEYPRKYSTDDSMLETASSPLASVTTSTIHTPQPSTQQHQEQEAAVTTERPLESVVEARVSLQGTPGKGVHVSPRRKFLPPRRTSLADDESDLSASLMSRKMAVPISTKSHLLRTNVFYTPAWCSVCGKSLMSGLWKVPSFRCEECGIDCCSDCRLQIDVQLPCGSPEARKAVRDAADTQFTTDKLLQLVAPIEQSKDNDTTSAVDAPPNHLNEQQEVGIGLLKFKFFQACALTQSLPPESTLDFGDIVRSELRRSDYYVRIVKLDSNGTTRTKTVQQSTRPQFDSSDMTVSVPSYASQFRVELVDALDDSPVGFLLLTTQMLLQEQRDAAMKNLLLPLPQFKFQPRRLVRELRRFVKSGTSNEYFPERGEKTMGEVVGLIEFEVILEENWSALYGSNPYTCPARPNGDLDLTKITAHIRRISQIINDAKAVFSVFGYITSWRNPVLTAAAFIAFAVFCFRVNPDHFFTGPVFLLALYMGYLAILRTSNGLAYEYQERELAAHRDKTFSSKFYKLHRPCGLINMTVRGGRNIRSPELGLSGSVSCRVSVDFGRNCSEKYRKELSTIDGSVGASHLVGSTETVFSSTPKWGILEESEESKHLRHIIPSQDGFFENSSPKQKLSYLEFPVLQPIVEDKVNMKVELRPWSDSKAAVIFEVLFHDFASIIPGEYCIGEVAIPLPQLVKEGEIKGWFKLAAVSDSELSSIPSNTREEDWPAIDLDIKWLPPTKVPGLPNYVEHEASIAVQEELHRAAGQARKKNKGLVGTSLGAIDTFRDIRGYLLAVQNGLGSVLDAMEASKNLVNFTDPAKSFVVVFCLCLVWLVLYHIPFRISVFLLGSVPYTTAFHARFLKRSRKARDAKFTPSEADHAKRRSSSPLTWIRNFVRGLPVDEDLRHTYFWETRRKVAKLLQEEADQRRSSRLQKLWRANWYDTIQVLKQSSDGKAPFIFESSFGVMQGRRFMVWKSAEDFDRGEQPVAKVFLQGHAGLSTPSPIEFKAIGSDLQRAASIFGRGIKEQQRITFLVSTSTSKEKFESSVAAALDTKDD